MRVAAYINMPAWELEQLVKKQYGADWSFSKSEGAHALEVRTFININGKPREPLVDEWVAEMKAGTHSGFGMAENFLNDLCMRGVLMAGDYLITPW